MQRVCGLKIEWTTSLPDHLYLDRRRKALKMFPYKCHCKQLSKVIEIVLTNPARLPIPFEVLHKTILSLDLLFSFWDNRAISFLKKEKQTFQEYGPFEMTKSLTLLDFNVWRDRL
ncbi:hypothetical protein N431DRAFT_507329, partial [Stipitochalara longipes BDJ]